LVSKKQKAGWGTVDLPSSTPMDRYIGRSLIHSVSPNQIYRRITPKRAGLQAVIELEPIFAKFYFL